jgi:hypothetical protein
MTRDLAGRCDLEPQRIGDLALQRMLGHRRAAGHVNAIKLQPRLGSPWRQNPTARVSNP